MKKILSVLLAGVLMVSACSAAYAAEFTDVSANDYFYAEAQTLAALGIVAGDETGTLRPYDPISRGEFAKLTAGMQNKLDEARTEQGASMFMDVDSTHWAVPYINYVAKNNIIVGYPDGTYHADEPITYAQAITVVLRVLGYDETTVSGFWPDSYVSKAARLELTKDMQFDPYANITRADAFVIIARALETDMYAGKANLAASFGYTILEEVIVLSTRETDASLATGELKTLSGVYKCKDEALLKDLSGRKVKLYLNEKNEVEAVAPYADYPVQLVIKKHLGGNDYLCVSGNTEVQKHFSDSITVYSKSGKSNYAQMRSGFVAGAVVSLHGENKDAQDYVYLSDVEDVTPVVATKAYTQGDTSIGGIALKNAGSITVYRDGYSADLGDIQMHDVIYYNPVVNVMEVYTDKVTGLYEEALPNKANVEQVVVGGRTFTIGASAATRQLDESAGSFKINEVITLLLGKNGEVVGVCNTQTASVSTSYGVLVSAGTYVTDKVTDSGTTKYQIKLMMSDGNVYTYDADKDYSDYKGKLVRLRFTNGIAALTKTETGAFSGDVSQTERSIGTTRFASGAVLYDLVSNPTNGDATVVLLDFEDLKSISVDSNMVLASVKEGSFGEVAVVLFDDVMRTNVKYGIVEKIHTQKVGDGAVRTYTVRVDGMQQTVVRQGTFSVSGGSPVMVSYAGNQIESLDGLAQVATASSIQAMDYSRIKVNNRVYTLCSDLLIYRYMGNNEYHTMSRTELENATVTQVTLYKDFTGQIRALKVDIK